MRPPGRGKGRKNQPASSFDFRPSTMSGASISSISVSGLRSAALGILFRIWFARPSRTSLTCLAFSGSKRLSPC